MIKIFTHSYSPVTKEFWKWLGRSLTGKYSGPQAVRDSLVRGLTELGVSYSADPLFLQGNTAIVLSGVVMLKKAISLKKEGKIKRLIVGPNVVVTPDEANRILFDPAIDMILVPSQWVKDYYRSAAPELDDKVKVWPAGVAKARPSSRDGKVIIYCKDDKKLCVEAKKTVRKAGYKAGIFEYGTFSRQEYLEALGTAPAVVYISKSESQGLAMQEAWIRNVPTFVHYTGWVKNDYFNWQDEKINAPYLEDSYGAFYKDTVELSNLLDKIDSYQPQTECLKKLSDKVSAAMLLDLINSKVNL